MSISRKDKRIIKDYTYLAICSLFPTMRLSAIDGTKKFSFSSSREIAPVLGYSTKRELSARGTCSPVKHADRSHEPARTSVPKRLDGSSRRLGPMVFSRLLFYRENVPRSLRVVSDVLRTLITSEAKRGKRAHQGEIHSALLFCHFCWPIIWKVVVKRLISLYYFDDDYCRLFMRNWILILSFLIEFLIKKVT